MKEKRATRRVIFIAILLLVAAVPLLMVGVGWAQEGDQGAVNQERGVSETVADIVITDPEADLSAIVAETTGAVSASTVIPAAAFVDDGFADQNYGVTFAWGAIYPYPNGSSMCIQAPVYLPDGATVTAFGGHIYDNSTSDYWRVELRRVALTNLDGSTSMANAPSSGATNAVRVFLDETIADAVVDNSAFSYFTAVCASSGDSNLRLYAVQVFYTQ